MRNDDIWTIQLFYSCGNILTADQFWASTVNNQPEFSLNISSAPNPCEVSSILISSQIRFYLSSSNSVSLSLSVRHLCESIALLSSFSWCVAFQDIFTEKPHPYFLFYTLKRFTPAVINATGNDWLSCHMNLLVLINCSLSHSEVLCFTKTSVFTEWAALYLTPSIIYVRSAHKRSSTPIYQWLFSLACVINGSNNNKGLFWESPV